MNESPSPIGFVAPEPSQLAPFFPGYEIHDLVATGGMGAVYRALQKSLDRTVAIKILPLEFSEDAEFCAGFEAEAKAMARLNHPNLIAVYDFGEVNGMLYIVMEFVPGKSLYHSANGVAIEPGEAARLVTGICNGLAHAHENGILHRDIKPSNILLTPQKEPKIGDFGLARPVEKKTQAGEVIFGTPGYTAPEVVNTPDQVDHRADLFCVGVMLHELLTGKLPAADSRPASVISGCDVRFDAIIRRATHPQPAGRYSSAAEIAAELQAITSSRSAGSIAKMPAVAKGGMRRPPQPVRARSAGVKRKSLNLTWIGPLVAVVIMVYSWHTFANMKPRTVVIKDPAAKSSAAGSSEEEVDPFASSSANQKAPPSDSSSLDAANAAADRGRSVFLDDLNETEVKIGYGRLGKHGSGPERSGSPALVHGIKPNHSLCPHPFQHGTSSVSYALNSQFSIFSGTATVADNAEPRSLRFCIKGDGKTLWRSEIIQTGKHAEEFSVSVKGINRLELEIECPGSASVAWGMWVSPRLLTASIPEQPSGAANSKSTEYAGSKNSALEASIDRSSSTARVIYSANTAAPPAPATAGVSPQTASGAQTPKVELSTSTPAPTYAKPVTSDFEKDADGWSGINTSNQTENLSFLEGGSNTASRGYVSVSENKGDEKLSFFASPAKFHGDKRLAYLGHIRFHLKQYATTKTWAPYPLVVLKSKGQELHFHMNQAPSSTKWTRYDIPINENSQWIDIKTSAGVTKEVLLQVLGELESLWVLAEYSGNNHDRADLDDFEMIAGGNQASAGTYSATRTAPPAVAEVGALTPTGRGAGMAPDVVGTWKYSDTIQLELRPDGTVLSNAKPAGKWTRRDKITEYYVVLNDRSAYIATLDKYKRILTTEGRARGEKKSMARIDDGPTKNLNVPDQRTAWKMEGSDMETEIKAMELRCEAAKRDAADKWQKHSEARANGRISSWNIEAERAERQASWLEKSITEFRVRLAELKSKLGEN